MLDALEDPHPALDLVGQTHVGFARQADLLRARRVQPREHARGRARTPADLRGGRQHLALVHDRLETVTRDVAHAEQRGHLRRTARIFEEHRGNAHAGNAGQRPEHARLPQDVAVADRRQPGGSDLDHDAALPRRSPFEVDAIGQARAPARQRLERDEARPRLPAGQHSVHALCEPVQVAVHGWAPRFHSIIAEIACFGHGPARTVGRRRDQQLSSDKDAHRVQPGCPQSDHGDASLNAGPFFGWRIIAVGIAAQALGVGLIQAYGFFVTPLAVEFSASMAHLGAGLSLFMLTGALIGPVLGPALDRGGARTYMLAGVGAMLLGMWALSRAGSLAQLGAALMLVSAGVLLYGPLPVHWLVVNWFVARRGRALSLAALGISIPGFFVPVLTAWLIDALGWRSALIALGLGAAALVVPVLIAWVVSRPEDVGQAPDGEIRTALDASRETVRAPRLRPRELLADRNFWIIAVGCGLVATAPILNGAYLVRHMEQAGISRQGAAFVMSWIAGFAVLGKLLTAALADRIDKRMLTWGLVALQLAAWAAILPDPSYATMLVAGVGFGLGVGGFVPLPALFIGTWFGRAAFGQVAGLMSPIRLPITLSIVPSGGWLADQSGGHAATFAAAIAVALAGALLLLFLRAPRVREAA